MTMRQGINELPTYGGAVPSSFFVLRTPLLPFGELETWSEAGEEEETTASARCRLRVGLLGILERPEIREALYVASPDLESAVETWRRQPESKKGKRAEHALVRYFCRMATRPTPFGLFSGCSVGRLGQQTRLRLDERKANRRSSRLDTDYLFALNEALALDPQLRHQLYYRPNSSLYQAAGRVRFVEARLKGTFRTHQLVTVETSDYLDEVLRQASPGARLEDLAACLVTFDPDGEITLEEAVDFIDELIDSQILISNLSPLVTGREALCDLLAQLRQLVGKESVIERLEDTRDQLAALDAAGLGNEPRVYREVAKGLESLPAQVHLSKLFQVDMMKPAGAATLGSEVLEEISRGIQVLRSLHGPVKDPLQSFRRDFVARYEGRWVPLVEVLDEEIGLGFESPQGPGAAASPLLAGLVFPLAAGQEGSSWGRRENLLLNKLTSACSEALQEIELTAEDLGTLRDSILPDLPPAFQALATVVAASEEAIVRGDFLVHLKHIAGPSGARLMGRFCHADDELRQQVEQHLREEEALDPEALYAEVVHLPEGRHGNVILRPKLRHWEIPFLGRGGSSPEHQIPVTDLELAVQGDELILRSLATGRRVIPRMTNAHRYSGRGPSLYRFLCTLQSQGVCDALYWHWRPLDNVGFLPRVRCGRLILCRARWRVSKEEIRELIRSRDQNLLASVDRWRAKRQLPRWVIVVEGDQELPVDFRNVLSIDAFLSLIERRTQVVLEEFLAGPGQLCASGPEGLYTNEIVVPFVRRQRPRTEVVSKPSIAASGTGPFGSVRRRFPIGSEWLYAKIYTGRAAADEILIGSVRPLVREAIAEGAVDRWFFIRYGDPEWHLRLRLHGEPGRLHQEVVPRLQSTLASLLGSGRIWRWQLDTYEREVERYGGTRGIELAERLFSVDSDAVLELLSGSEGDDGADDRWQLCLRGVDLLLSDLGLGLSAKSGLVTALRKSFGTEFGAEAPFTRQLALKFRRDRPVIEDTLEASYDAGHPLAYGFRILEQRSELLAPIASELKHCLRSGLPGVSATQLAASFVHMFANRMLRSEGRAHELVLYDFLSQVLRSRIARQRDELRRRQAV